MDRTYNILGLFSGSTLKIIACAIMLIDHIGLVLYDYSPEVFEVFRIIGRLAFPIFAFFIAEGTRYSRHKWQRLATIFSIGLVLFLFYYFYDGRLYGNIFLTFSISILLDMFFYQYKKSLFSKSQKILGIGMLAAFAATVFLVYRLYTLIRFEYGFFGMLLPVMINLTNFKDIEAQQFLKKLDNHWVKILILIICSLLLSIDGNLGIIQYYCLFAIIPLALYNGKPGFKKLKYVFYIFYPAHLIIIEGISMIISFFK